MGIKHIYWFSYYNLDSPSVRYRAKYALEDLSKNHNITYSFVHPSYKLKNIVHFTLLYFSVLFFRKRNSVIIFQKIYTSRIYSSALKTLLFFRRKYTIYDIDDAEYEKVSATSINYFIKNCKTCTVGSNALLKYAQKLNSNAFILTSPIIEHNFIKTNTNNIFTIGWVGFYNAHKESLTNLFFPSILNSNFKLKLVLIGVTNEEHKREIHAYYSKNKNILIDIPENIDWHNDLSIYEIIKGFDVGISPLLNNEINRAKSAFKAKQYLSCGIPVLGSSVGENAVVIKDGINGYLCNTHEEYHEKIHKIIALRKEEYAQLSKNALNSIYTFNMANYSKALLELVN